MLIDQFANNKSEIFTERLILAVVWNVLLQISLAIILVFLIQVDLFHPISWITYTFTEIMSWKMLVNIILLSLVSCFQAYIYGSYYIVPLPKVFTRFSMFINMFTVQNIMFSSLYALSGYFTMSLYSSLAKSNYNTLKKKCEHYDGQCLIEQSLFLQFGGMWMGLYYFLTTHIFSSTTLLFPHIYQDKLQQMKLVVGDVISKGFYNSLMPTLYYSIFYYLWGNKPRAVVSDVYSIYLEDPPLDRPLNLISSGIWIGLWFYTSLFFISVYTMRTAFNIVLTEPLKFPIESVKNLTLSKALAQRSQFTAFLAAQDLKLLSVYDNIRRKEIFLLSQPGGHPRNWNDLLEQCLEIINDFTRQLEAINCDIRPSETDQLCYKKINVTSPMISPFKPGIRNMAQSPKLFELKDHNPNKLENTFIDNLKSEVTTYIKKLGQKPGISYFFGELTDTKLKFLLMQSQPVMWTCEGLAFISAASLSEDKYGVVQNDLGTVITTLVNLKVNIDKLTKLGLVPRKQILNDIFAIKMKSALTSSVKRSIYKIVLTFLKYIDEIPLENEVRVAIRPLITHLRTNEILLQ